MFHRVKSETPQAQGNFETQTPMYPEQTPSRPAEATSFQQASQVQAPASPPAQKQFQNEKIETSQNQKKDKDMNTPEQNSANTTETTSTPNASPARSLDIPGGSAYQRAGQPPVRSYPGAYPAAYSPHTSASATTEAGERRLTIGRGITMSGEIESCDYLMVEGTVEAALKGASMLDIAESGVFYGTVEINEATIAGRFEGDITVNGRLTIRSSGTIIGSIAYKELEVESGAMIEGRLTATGLAGEGKKPQGSKNKDQRPKEPKAQRQQEAANNDGELFASKATAAE